ncbi:ras-domain-containing protein [Serendipita vermifera]|nr:ras-domain-containing protein [Serendipita vermifera]
MVYTELDDLENLQYCSDRSEYVRQIDGFLLAYSITDKSSLDALEELLKEILRLKGTERVPFVVVGNKCDAEYDRQVLRNGDGRDFAAKWRCLHFETSAKLEINVERAYIQLIKLIKRYEKGEDLLETRNLYFCSRKDSGQQLDHCGCIIG